MPRFITKKWIEVHDQSGTAEDRYKLRKQIRFKASMQKSENEEYLDVVLPMYNLLEYSKNYSKTTGSLWNYYRDELTDETNDDNGTNKNEINSKSFKYKINITGSTYNVPRITPVEDGNPADNPNYDQRKRGTKAKDCCAIKTSRQFLEQFKYSISQLLSIFGFTLACNLCSY